MGKLEEAKGILTSIGMPKPQTNDRSGYILLSLAQIKETDGWDQSTNSRMRIVDIMNYMADNYDKIYKPNSRETIRKETIHQFVDGAVAEKNIDDTWRPTNSPQYSYRLTEEMQTLIKTYGTKNWDKSLENFKKNNGTLIEKYSQQREITRVPVVVNGVEYTFSPGEHNQLQKDIIEEFGSRFAPGAEVLYLGDTEKKDLIKNREKFEELRVAITDHDKLPDVVLYDVNKNWLYFIESVTSVGPISRKRMLEIEEMTKDCDAGNIYVTAFPDSTTYKKFVDELAWDTEVWLAEEPDHLIHLNGDRFVGPR